MPNKEAAIQKWVRDELDKEYGSYCVYIKYPAGQYSTKGVADLIFCIHGLYVAIEVKTDTGTLTKLQEMFLEKVRAADGKAYVIYGKDHDKMGQIIRYINASL